MFRRNAGLQGLGLSRTCWLWALALILASAGCLSADALTLAKDAATEYRIVIVKGADVSDKAVAEDFAGILREITGATFAVALQVAQNAPEGAGILCMLPDTGERYLSTPLFGDIGEEMSADELEISASTPNYQLPA